MKTTQKIKSPKKLIILIAGAFIILIIATMALTRVGAIPNVFDIDFLCPNSGNSNRETYFPNDNNQNPYGANMAVKPVIYLYPQTTTDVTVKLNFSGTLMTTYPQYNSSINGWQVTASPDGQLVNKADGESYSYLFWDGTNKNNLKWDTSKGFIVTGKDAAKFLQEKLAAMGLTPKEYNEFIVYWLPKMEYNKYNLISFMGSQYTDTAKLEIVPKPDSILRVFMVFKPLDKPIAIKPQIIQSFERKGFAVVEWGGSEIK